MKKKIINNFTSEISKSLKKIKLKNKKNIYVTSNLSAIGRVPVEKKIKLKIILEEIKKSMGKNYTIFSPAATMNLCNTQNVFDLYNTPSYKMGPLAEYIRKKNSVRSAHPYWSISGIGKNKNLIKNSSAHGYGVGSPWSTMLDLNTTQLNIGINPERAVTLIHHIETIVGVPYRYNKEFKHKIKKKNKIEEKKFYLSVRFKNIKIEKRKKLNKHFFDELKKNKKINFYKSKNGLEFWSFNMKDFYNVSVKFFNNNIYNYLEKPLNLSMDI